MHSSVNVEIRHVVPYSAGDDADTEDDVFLLDEMYHLPIWY